MKRLFGLLFLAWAALVPAAGAQLGGVQLPQVPNVGDVLDRAADPLAETTDRAAERLREARRQQVRTLLRTHRRELEADPAGQPVVRSQILGLEMSADAIAAARDRGFQIVRTDPIDGVLSLTTLRAPADMPTRRALRLLRELDGQATYDFDHLYLESGAGAAVATVAQASATGGGPRIGLIDGGVDGPVAAQRAFAGDAPVRNAHGVLVAELIRRAAPGARIYAADIYAGVPTGGASSALARALSWLAGENVAVINVSLVGPRNRIVEAVVQRLIGRGFVIVAAVGNDGPAADPLYPAAYEGVVGVTGVDAHDRVLIEAGRGAQVDFAALGVHGRARGTSFAAPIVAARLAPGMAAPSAEQAARAVAAIRSEARDLGARGRDNVYGYGLVGAR